MRNFLKFYLKMLPVACTPRKNIYRKNSFILRWKVTRVLSSFNSWFFKWLLLKPKGYYHQPEYHGTLIDVSGSFKAKPFFSYQKRKIGLQPYYSQKCLPSILNICFRFIQGKTYFFLPKKKDRFATLLFPEMPSFYSHTKVFWCFS